jgi:DeoR/GlpR family transcriptional regulator of sugar metabolism
MLPQERYQKIIDYLQGNKMIRIDQMAEMFGISVETVRRDLGKLEKDGVVKKVYGGATLVRPETHEAASSVRMQRALAQKQAIGRRCAEFIDDGDQVLLGVGTTTLQVAKALKTKKDLTVITNSVYIAAELLDTDFTVYMIGGRVRADEGAVSGSIALMQLDDFRIGKAVIGTGGITAANGLSDYNIEEAMLRKKVVERADEVIVAADSGKFGRDVLTRVCPIGDVSLIVTDRGLQQRYMDELREAGVEFVLA